MFFVPFVVQSGSVQRMGGTPMSQMTLRKFAGNAYHSFFRGRPCMMPPPMSKGSILNVIVVGLGPIGISAARAVREDRGM